MTVNKELYKEPYIEDSGLIIGGSHDGEVRFVADKLVDVMQLVVYEPVKPFPAFTGMMQESLLPRPTVRKEYYRREMIRGRESIYSLWVHESLTIDDALERLLKGYSRA